jgi:hypothetical protein
LPLIENFANVLQRRLGYSRASADEKAWLLEQYSREGPLPSRQLFNEIQDDRYVLETALAGTADILAACRTWRII